MEREYCSDTPLHAFFFQQQTLRADTNTFQQQHPLRLVSFQLLYVN